jgi:hypothetical protein
MAMERKAHRGENAYFVTRIYSLWYSHLQNKLDKACRENSESNSNAQTQDGSVHQAQFTTT